ncbi:MAG: LLM class F420-dependent oxidoreductase [Pseudomonadales bacterium]
MTENLSVVTPLWQDRPPAENVDVALTADKLGYPQLWIGEMATFDAFAFATAVGAQTKQISLTIGPLAVAVRTPMTMAMGVASVAALTGRKVRLAIGSSSTVVVEAWHGRPRVRSAKHLDEAAIVLRGLLDGEKVNYEGELVRSNGYHLRLDAPGANIAVAAFGPAAVRVAARRADYMLLNLVTSASVARLRTELELAAAKAQRPMPKLAVWLTAAIDPVEETIVQLLRAMVGYLAAPGYAEMFIEAGFEELVELARGRPHPKQILAAMSPGVAAAVGAIGDEATVRSKIEEYRAAGADEVCIVPATAGDPGGSRTLEALRRV